MKEDQLRRFDTRDFYIFFKLSTVSRWGKVTKPRAGFLPVSLGSHKTVDISDRLEFPASSRRSGKQDWKMIQKKLGDPKQQVLLCRVNPHIPHFSNNFTCVSLMVFTSVKPNPSVFQPVKQLKVTDAEALNNQVSFLLPVLTTLHICHNH